MSEVVMFNKNDLAYFILQSNDRASIDKMKDNGFIENPKLVNMYHRDLKKYVMVPVQDTKLWEEKGYFAEPTMIYNPKEETQMVSSSEAKKACANGWYLSPEHFPENKRSDGMLTLGAKKEAS